ncbi:MAG: hypothetical protein HY720_10220 [Planctomycetes bacterium]|nr:hypothetical protein [Planctomycetota bacterium]
MRHGTLLAATLVALLLAAPAVLAQEEFSVMRIEQGEKLEYRVLSASQYDQTKGEVEDAYKQAAEEWRKSRTGDEPARPKITKVSGKFATQEEADAAARKDADKTGYFECWRCQGTGEVMDELKALSGGGPGGMGMGMGGRPAGGGANAPQAEPCPVCKGRKRTKSDGYIILKITYGDAWGYRLVRKGMLNRLNELAKILAAMQAQAGNAGGGQNTPKPGFQQVSTFSVGEFDDAKAAFDKLQQEAESKDGFVSMFNVPGFELPEVSWPREFFAKQQ